MSDLLRRAPEAFAAAAERTEPTETWVRFGGLPVRLRMVGAGVNAALLRPIRHLVVDEPASGRPALTVHAWAAADGPAALDLPPGDDRIRLADFTDDHCVMAWPSERLVMAYDRRTAEAWWWVPDIAAAPMFEQAMPFRPLLHWWGQDHSVHMVHAAAVGTVAAGGVLLGGVSGSGKSTTSLFALTSDELRFLGDDYVLVRSAPEPEVFSVYSTAKVHEPDRSRVPHVTTEVVGWRDDDKLVAFLGDHFAEHLIERLPLRAVLLPRLSDDGPELRPIATAEALRRLGPSTVLQFPGPAPTEALGPLAALVRAVPCFDFPLGPDPAATPDAIAAGLRAIQAPASSLSQ